MALSVKEISRRWREAHPEGNKEKRRRYRIKHPETARASVRTWQLANPEKRRINEHTRRTRLTKAGGSYTQEEWQSLCKKHKDCCLSCGEHKPLTADHIIPVSKGGSSNIDNIQPLCMTCNSIKGSTTKDFRNNHEQRAAVNAGVSE